MTSISCQIPYFHVFLWSLIFLVKCLFWFHFHEENVKFCNFNFFPSNCKVCFDFTKQPYHFHEKNVKFCNFNFFRQIAMFVLILWSKSPKSPKINPEELWKAFFTKRKRVKFLCILQLIIQGHLRSTCDFPPSSYSCLEIHICWKEPKEAKMEPPIHEPNLRSCTPLAAMSLQRIVAGVLLERSRFSLSVKPWINVLPPVKTTDP